MQFFDHAPDIEKIAQAVADSGNLILVPAFTGLGAPHWDPYAAGMLIGLQRDTEIGHIARAALESIAFQVTDVLLAMENDTGSRSTRLRADGGAAANDMLMQFQADVLGIPVERPAILETTAQGAAYLAGLSVGYWNDVNEIAATRPAGQVFTPHQERSTAQRQYVRWQDAVTRAKGWNKVLA
jgi:glycerol kinase